jgi:phosphonoacetaldehyde hydrolase
VKLQAVIFDWAGTVVDHGSRAPVATLLEIFNRAGVPITVEEARLSMGIAKRDHIRAILKLPRVKSGWEQRHGSEPEVVELNSLYAEFIPIQFDFLESHSDVIEGVPAAVEHLKSHGIKIGSTTGYTRPMLDVLLKNARSQGFNPDCAVCPDDVPGGGRPAPWMCYLNAIRLEAAPLSAMIKIGDTPSDIAEGLNAGMWTIGITRTGNEIGLTQAEWDLTPVAQQLKLIDAASARLRQAGAHYIVASVNESLASIEEIASRIAAGERP